MDIEYTDIPGFPNYKISKCGKVMSLFKNRVLSSSIMKGNGYLASPLSKDGKSLSRLIHRLLAITFIPNPENKPCVNHIDGNKLNNSLDNLEWCTYYENNRHALDTGLRPTTKGTQTWTCKLKEEDVLEIRRLYESGIKRRFLAKQFLVSRDNISSIVSRESWKHI